MDNLRKKYLQEVIQDGRVERNLQAKDFLAILQNAGALPEQRYRVIKDALDSGFKIYRINLLEQAKAMGSKKSFDKLIANPDLLTTEIIEQDGNLTNLECLILHHVCLLNKFQETIDSTEESLYGPNALVNYIKLFDNIDKFSRYAVDVGQEDADSFRQYSLISHIAYSGFTSEIWYKLLENKSIDKSVESLVKSISNAIKPPENGKADPVQLTYGGFAELGNNTFKDAHGWLLKHTNWIEELSSNIALKIVPSFLGVRNDNADENKFKVTLFELLEHNPELEYKSIINVYLNATHPFAKKYLSDTEYKENCTELEILKKEEAKLYEKYKKFSIEKDQKLKENINYQDKNLDAKLDKLEKKLDKLKEDLRKVEQTVKYSQSQLRLIKFADNAKDIIEQNKSNNTQPTIDLDTIRDKRDNVILVIKQAESLLVKELYLGQHLSEEQQTSLTNIISTASPQIRQRLVSFIDGFDSVDEGYRDKVTKFLNEIEVKQASKVLISAALEAIATNNNPKVEYYKTIIKDAKKKLAEESDGNLVGIDAELIKYIDNINIQALRYLAISKDPNSILKEGDHFSVFGGMFNPTEFAISNRMSSYACERIKNIKEIERAIKFINAQLETKVYLDLDESDFNKPVKDAYARLNDNLLKLEKLKNDLEHVNSSLTLNQLVKCADDQVKELDKVNRHLERKSASVFRIFSRKKYLSAEDREMLKEKYENDLDQVKNKVNQIKELIKSEAIKTKILNEIKDLNIIIASLTKQGYKFDYLVDELELLEKHLNPDSSLNISDLTRSPSSNPFTRDKAWYVKRMEQGITVFKIAKGIVVSLVFMVKSLYTLVTYIPSNIIKVIAKHTSNNKNFSKDVSLMISSLDKDLQSQEAQQLLAENREYLSLQRERYTSKFKLSDEKIKKYFKLKAKLSNPYVSAELDKYLQLKQIKQDLNTMQGNIGRVRMRLKVSFFGNRIISPYNTFSYKNLRFNQYKSLKRQYFKLTDEKFYAEKFKDNLKHTSFTKVLLEQDKFRNNQRLNDTKVFIEEREDIINEEAEYRSELNELIAKKPNRPGSPVTSDSDVESLLSSKHRGSLLDDLLDSSDSTVISSKLEQSCNHNYVVKLRDVALPKATRDINKILETHKAHKDHQAIDKYAKGQLDNISAKLSEIISKPSGTLSTEDFGFISKVEVKLSSIKKEVNNKVLPPKPEQVVKAGVKEAADSVVRKVLTSVVVNTAFDEANTAFDEAEALLKLSKQKTADKPITEVAKDFFKFFADSVVEQQGGKHSTAIAMVDGLKPEVQIVAGVTIQEYFKHFCSLLPKYIDDKSKEAVTKIDAAILALVAENPDSSTITKLQNLKQDILTHRKTKALEVIAELSDQVYSTENLVSLYKVYSEFSNIDSEIKKALTKQTPNQQVVDKLITEAVSFATDPNRIRFTTDTISSAINVAYAKFLAKSNPNEILAAFNNSLKESIKDAVVKSAQERLLVKASTEEVYTVLDLRADSIDSSDYRAVIFKQLEPAVLKVLNHANTVYFNALVEYVNELARKNTALVINKLNNSDELKDLDMELSDELNSEYEKLLQASLSKLGALSGLAEPSYDDFVKLIKIYEQNRDLEKDLDSKTKSYFAKAKDLAIRSVCGAAGAIIGSLVGAGATPNLSTILNNSLIKSSITAAAEAAYDKSVTNGKSLTDAREAAVDAVKQVARDVVENKLGTAYTAVKSKAGYVLTAVATSVAANPELATNLALTADLALTGGAITSVVAASTIMQSATVDCSEYNARASLPGLGGLALADLNADSETSEDSPPSEPTDDSEPQSTVSSQPADSKPPGLLTRMYQGCFGKSEPAIEAPEPPEGYQGYLRDAGL